ncbi:MAG: NADH-quinone oxidoreductase subunit L [Candidatus Methylacidiphilales bacterium]|nr:NADH-quinone oxidoreductase subunit L [Candidatus Methylacidiphilales bacterium]
MNWIILLTPLLAAVLAGLAFRSVRSVAVGISVLACAVSFAASVWVFINPDGLPFGAVEWINIGALRVTLGGISDPLSRLMLLIVTGVGLLIHIFSLGYMKDDPSMARFFAQLSFFMFAMLGIVLADNLVMMFIFWELVGLASYLLIGFWFHRPAAAEAAKKAFIVNRLGDFGFMIGILTVWAIWGTVDFHRLQALTEAGLASAGANADWVVLAGIGLFLGCVGKSAQFPLHVWLPDAMEGPTPVSALIHAATMVAAGVYMLARVFFILELNHDVLSVITLTGTVTAVFAALIALQQNDIKRILAYSTLSQLGYMVAAVGIGAWQAALFHLATHAFFKALLFLGAGSVIHAVHHEQDIWKMGGLGKKMPLTFATFTLGTLALTGCPLLAGFFSKEAILAAAHGHQAYVFYALLFTAALTAFYMFRLWTVAFLGHARSEAAGHAHESPAVMTAPLVILAVLSVAGGYLGIPALLAPAGEHATHAEGSHVVMILSVSAFVLAAAAGFGFYRSRTEEPFSLSILRNKFYSDEIYGFLVVRPHDALSRAASWFDQWIIGGLLVRGSSAFATFSGEILRLFQGGNVQAYVVLFVLGIAILCYCLLIRPFP